VVAKGEADESNTIAIEAGHQKEYDVADKELNTGYNEAMETIEPAAKQKLKDAQKAWLKSRDANIAFMIKQNEDCGTYGSIIVSDLPSSSSAKARSGIESYVAGARIYRAYFRVEITI
jgi:Uncharacterized protein conserved in bacteria